MHRSLPLTFLTLALTALTLPACDGGGSGDASGPSADSTANGKPQMPNEAAPRVQLVTNMGEITVELDPAKAPISTENFLKYVDRGHYAGTVFHRVIDGFMIQGGGFTKELTEKPTGSPIKNEAQNGLKNDRGTIAMARTQDPDSATAQFFINVADNAGLNYPQPDGAGYAVFGKVVQGMDVVDKIKAVETDTATATIDGRKVPMPNVPVEPVVIKEATKLE